MDVRASSLMSAPTQPARHALLDVSALVSVARQPPKHWHMNWHQDAA